MDFLVWLKPIEWVVASLMAIWHTIFSAIGLGTASGAGWASRMVNQIDMRIGRTRHLRYFRADDSYHA